jgi:hypothetical protein
MSSSVTVDWRAVREQERQTCLALRAELAQLRERAKQLRVRAEAAAAAYGRAPAEIARVGRGRGDADSTELGRLVTEARAGLAHSAATLERTIGEVTRERSSRANAPPAWTMRGLQATAPAPEVGADVDLDQLVRESRRGKPIATPATPARAGEGDEAAHAAAEADVIIEECRIRCPAAGLGELTRLRTELGTSPLGDRAVVQDIRARAAKAIQRVKRENELEEQRQRMFVLAEEAPPAERARLRRRVANAPSEDLPRLDREVVAAVERAAAERSRSEAVAALQESLKQLGYDVQGGFASLLPAPSGGSREQEFLVASSPHSPDHGLRVRVGEEQLYLSVVRRAGTAVTSDAHAADTIVQERTCADLADAAERAAGHGVQIVLGNARTPGSPAPELPADHWPAALSGREAAVPAAVGAEAVEEVVDVAVEERRRAPRKKQEHRRPAERQRAKTMRPGR